MRYKVQSFNGQYWADEPHADFADRDRAEYYADTLARQDGMQTRVLLAHCGCDV